jgi:hypothetical protein
MGELDALVMEGLYDFFNVGLPVFLLSFFWAAVCDVFFAVDYCAGAREAGFAGDLSAEFFSGLDGDWVVCGVDLGGEA